MSGRVPPSSRARQRSTGRSETQRAASRYERFTGHEAEIVGAVNYPPLPKAVTVIGTLDEVCYTTVRDDRRERYRHKFNAQSAPVLCVGPDGKQLYIVGGAYLFTERGIVDKRGSRE